MTAAGRISKSKQSRHTTTMPQHPSSSHRPRTGSGLLVPETSYLLRSGPTRKEKKKSYVNNSARQRLFFSQRREPQEGISPLFLFPNKRIEKWCCFGFCWQYILLFIPPAGHHLATPLQDALEVLVNGEGDGLAGSNTHDTRGDTLVETARAFLLPHVPVLKKTTSALSP